MAGLHIVLGSKTRKGPYEVLYAGDSASEARAAEGQSSLPWFTRLDNPVTVIKHNSRAAAEAVDEATAPSTDLELESEQSDDTATDAEPQQDLAPAEEAAPRGRRRG